MKFAYADPPYEGQSAKHYADHPDYAGEVDHPALIERLVDEYPDGWALSMHVGSIRGLLPLCPENTRVLAWCKSFASWKRGVYPAYAWEPVLLCGGRRDYGNRQTPRDFLVEPITLQKGISGAKPDNFCFWLFDCLGAMEGDELHDLFTGSGAVGRAWKRYHAEQRIPFPSLLENESLWSEARPPKEP